MNVLYKTKTKAELRAESEKALKKLPQDWWRHSNCQSQK